MKKKWSVRMTKDAESKLRADFSKGLITVLDIKVIRRWIADIESQGLDFVQHKADWRDHELNMGKKMLDVLDELVPESATPGELLRAMRKREGLTLEDMQKITGIRDNNLSAIENDRIEMSQHYAEVFAAALDVHPMVFLYPNGKFEKTTELKKIEKRAAKYRKQA